MSRIIKSEKVLEKHHYHSVSVNPSIFRQAVMNYQAQGLYKVVEGVYQLRGHEISKVTFFRVYPGTYMVTPQLSTMS
jgi:alkyl sulfatase BDS1-like metallo-beta-lactamase superfamily hydrolase